MADTYTKLIYHVTFSTKERRRLINESLREDLYAYIGGIVRSEDGVLLEVGGVDDHVHLLVMLKPSAAISALLRVVKSKSSKWVNEREKRGKGWFGWQAGYGAFTVSESQLETVRRYIQNQPEHHRRFSFAEEFVVLLERHGVEYDDRYLPK